MPDYTVESPVNHDGKLYQPGETITMDEEMAVPLLVVSAVSVSADANQKSGNNRPTAADAIVQVKEAATLEALEALAAGEDRKSVLAAIDARRKELAPGDAE